MYVNQVVNFEKMVNNMEANLTLDWCVHYQIIHKNNKEHIKEEKLYFDSENGFIDILRKELPTEIDLSKIYIRKYISSKITEDIENIPSEINFEQYLDEKNYMNGINKNYKLINFIKHIGDSAEVGHYTEYSLNTDKNWYFFDDDDDPKIIFKDDYLKQAYILMYQRI